MKLSRIERRQCDALAAIYDAWWQGEPLPEDTGQDVALSAAEAATEVERITAAYPDPRTLEVPE